MPPIPHLAPAESEQQPTEWKQLEYALSHDVEGSLRGIKGLARILTQKHAPRLEGEAADLLRLISGEADRVNRLVEALLDWSRCVRQPLALSWQDTTGVARDAFAAIVSAYPARKIEFRLSQLPRVWGEHVSLNRLFRELLSNAVKFTRDRPVAVISIAAREEDLETIVSVRDNGVGFDMAHTGQLFGLFRRLHRREEFDGDGAGLAIARQIVQLHRGRIWTEAQVEQGSVFHFTIPKPADDAPAPLGAHSVHL